MLEFVVQLVGGVFSRPSVEDICREFVLDNFMTYYLIIVRQSNVARCLLSATSSPFILFIPSIPSEERKIKNENKFG